jgi:type VI secretion system lysozyme-like protein
MPIAPRQHVAAVPLFERLTDRNPEQSREPKPLRTLSYSELMRSVQKEVARLLNTRSGHTLEELLGQPRSVLDYGCTDLLWVNPHDPQLLARLTQLMEETIEAFEPRLRGVSVKITSMVRTESRMALMITATLVTEELREPVSFQVTASPRGGDSIDDE